MSEALQLFNGIPKILWVGVVVVVILSFLPTGFRRKKTRTPTSFPYEAKPGLFTRNELPLFHTLREAFPELTVHGKVRLEDIVGVRRGLSREDRWRYRGHIKSRHVDYLLVDPVSGAFVCVVELDDASHAQRAAAHGDAIRSGALAAAGVPLLRVQTNLVGVDELRDRVGRVVAEPPVVPRRPFLRRVLG